jgi:hypothetical protein
MTILCHQSSPRRKDSFDNLIVDYSKDRPFEGWNNDQLLRCMDEALTLVPMNIEICTLILDEAKNAGCNLKKFQKKVRDADVKEISWLRGARSRVPSLLAEFGEPSSKPRNCKLYFILLTADTNTPVPWGIYIGQTSKKIEDRFAVHLDPNDPKGSLKVRKRGWQLLYSLSSLVPPMSRKEVLEFERMTIDSLRGTLERKPLRKLPPNRVKGG